MNRFLFGSLAAAVTASLIALVPGCGSSDDNSTGPTPVADSGMDSTTTVTNNMDASRVVINDGAIDVFTPPNTPMVSDRAGRAYIQKMLVSTPNQDDYNSFSPYSTASALVTDPTTIDPAAAETVGQDFQSNLVLLDSLDGTNDWHGGAADAGPDPDSGAYPHPLVAPLLTDGLLVDLSKPFSTVSYLDVELSNGSHTTCGGRWPGEDALDVTLSYLVSAKKTGISDGVPAPTKAPTQTFPYLAEPN